MQAFLAGEELENDDDKPHKCSNCHEIMAASKQLQLWTTPDILVLSLKRFLCKFGVTHKVNTFVDFPVQGWDISDYVLQPQVGGGEQESRLTCCGITH